MYSCLMVPGTRRMVVMPVFVNTKEKSSIVHRRIVAKMQFVGDALTREEALEEGTMEKCLKIRIVAVLSMDHHDFFFLSFTRLFILIWFLSLPKNKTTLSLFKATTAAASVQNA